MIEIRIEKGIPIPPRRPLRPRPQGSCSYCPNIPRPGKKTCDVCLKRGREAYQDRRARGLCAYGSRCDSPAAEGHSMCSAHLATTTNKIKALLNGRVSRGLCRRCGERPIVGTKTWCLVCYGVCGGKDSKPPVSPIPPSLRRVIRQFWRLDRIAERRARVEECLPFMDERSAEIFILRHGVRDAHDRTLEDIGNRLNLTRERVRQIEERELNRLSDMGIDTEPMRLPFDLQRPPRSRPEGSKHSPEEVAKRHEARRVTQNALRDGSLTRMPCEVCGDKKSDAHHVNYDKPLEIRWLCRKHHLRAHGKRKRPQAIKATTRTKQPDWIKRLGPCSNERYSASSIRSILLADKPKLKTLVRNIGISAPVLVAILRGERVTTGPLAKVLRYAESLKQQRAA